MIINIIWNLENDSHNHNQKKLKMRINIIIGFDNDCQYHLRVY